MNAARLTFFLLLLAAPSFAAAPLSDSVITVGTTIQDTNGQPWSYVLLGSPQPNLLAGKKFALYSKTGYPTNVGAYALRGTIFQQTTTPAITTLLNQSIALGEDLTSLSNVLNVLLKNIPGITNQPLAQKILTASQVSLADPSTAQTLALIGRMHPGLTLCAGQGFAEPISAVTTYEVREVNPGTGVAGDVVGRVTLVPGSPVILPPPGPPFQVVTNDPIDHLVIRLRWGSTDELRRLSLLSFGYNIWRITRVNAEASGYNVTPPTLNQLYSDTHFVRPNQNPATTSRDFTPSGATDMAADPVTVFFTDDNGKSHQLPPFNDGDEFYYFITARDILGRDGLVSAGGLTKACRRLRPETPTDVRVANTTVQTNQPRLMVSWVQNTNVSDVITQYWIYRWPNPNLAMTSDATPLANRVGVVAHLPATALNSFVDDSVGSPSAPNPSNVWYTVRAMSPGACADLLSPHSPPAWGVVRQRAGPPAPTGQVTGSCGTPAVIFQTLTTITNADGLDTVNWNYRFTCQRRDPGIAWVQFSFVDKLHNTTDTLAQVYFPPDGDVVQADYGLPQSGANTTNDLYCVVGTYYGLVSTPAVAHFTDAIGPLQRQEATFLAGQILETALDASDPLLLAINNGAGLSCLPAISATPDPSGTVRLNFNVNTGTPLLIRVLENNTWTSLGVHFPDSNNLYWVSYPACLVGPLQGFQGCVINLPAGSSDCAQHVPRGADDGPLAPIRIQFALTQRTKEYRVYRSADGGPLTLMSQGSAMFDPFNPQRQIVRTDDAMPPSPSRLCYYVQVLDENGNGSPLAFLGCKDATPPTLARPVLAEPQAAGSNAFPQMALTWFCPTGGVYRFQVKIERGDKPGSGQPSGLSSSKLTVMSAFNTKALYAGLDRKIYATVQGLSKYTLVGFDEAQLTPPIGANFGPGPKFTLTASVLPNVPYRISVAAMDAHGNVSDNSELWKFTWIPPVVLQEVPWPARPLPPIRDFDDNLIPAQILPFYPRVQAVLQTDGNFHIDERYPVGIVLGYMDNVQYFSNVRSTAFASYTVPSISSRFFSAPRVFPQDFVFRRSSGDPSRRGESLLPIVVYREQLTNAAFPRVSGNILQVSPMIESFAYSITNAGLFPPTATIVLYDRLLSIDYKFDPLTYQVHACLCLRDQQPAILGARYRYLVARFNNKREITEVIPAGEVTLPADPNAPVGHINSP